VAQVELEDLTKSFGDLVAVDHIDLAIKDGEIFVLLGPSGCGKTTTLRMIAGLETPDCGDIFIDRQKVNELSTRERDIAMMFQLPTVYPHLSVHDNISFPLRTQGYDQNLIEERVDQAAAILELTPQLNERASKLSGGKKQAVALARSIVREPQVFLMDEPTTALDAKLGDRLQKRLKIMHEDLNATVIYVTHDQMEALNLADRVAVMYQGEIFQVDSPTQIYAQPRNLFVANFMGSPGMNFLDCTIDGEGTIHFHGFDLTLPQDFNQNLNLEHLTDHKLIFGLRPENIQLTKGASDEASSDNLVPGKVDLLEPLGTETIVHVQLGEEIVKVQKEATFTAQPGDAVACGLVSPNLTLFDRESEQTIY